MTDTGLFPAGVNQYEGTQSWGDFVAEKAVYLLDAGWRIPALKGAASPEDFNQYEVIAFPAIDGEVTKGSSAATIGETFGMSAELGEAKADAAWKFMSFVSGEEGLRIYTEHGGITTYKFDMSEFDVDQLSLQYIDLINNQSMGYVIDAVMDGEGVNNLLNPGIQAVMLGTKTPTELAEEYEEWVAANDSNRQK